MDRGLASLEGGRVPAEPPCASGARLAGAGA